MIVRAVVALIIATMMHFAVGCGSDPCMDADYTTSGLCVHLDGFTLAAEDVDFVVHEVSQVANHHGLTGVDMAERLNQVGPVPVVMVPYESLGRDELNRLIGGCTYYATITPWSHDRIGGYSIRVIHGMGRDERLRILGHELLHIMGPEYIGTTPEHNHVHFEPYMFRAWELYDPTFPPQHTVEGITYTNIRKYLGMR